MNKSAIINAINFTRVLTPFISFASEGVAILRYHSVRENPENIADSIGIGITHSARLFKEQMELLARKYSPVSMDNVLDFVQGGKALPPRSVAITFDDGFVDNYEVAKPILDFYGIPATFYVTVSSLESPHPPWYIRLRHAFFTSHQKIWLSNEEGTSCQLSDEQSRNSALIMACQQCAKLAGKALNKAIAEIEEMLQVATYVPDPSLMLTWEQVKRIHAGGHIIGSHTLTHPNMAYIQDADILLEEMASSKKQIEEYLGEPVIHFSYPSPMLEPHWSEHTIDACRKTGYKTATTCTSGKVLREDNPLALKRMWVPFNMQEFKWYLDCTLLGRTM